MLHNEATYKAEKIDITEYFNKKYRKISRKYCEMPRKQETKHEFNN